MKQLIEVDSTDEPFPEALHTLITVWKNFGCPEDKKMTGHCDLPPKTDTNRMTSIGYHLGVSSEGME